MGVINRRRTQTNADFGKEDNLIGEYFADILVENHVIVELKTVEKLDRNHEAQLLNYLKATGSKVGTLVNFNKTKAEIKGMVLNLQELYF